MPTKEQIRKQHLNKMKQIKLDNLAKEYKDIENDARYKKKKNKLEESKFYIRLMFLLVIEIVVFSQIIMWRTGDLSALYALIGISATLSASLISYYIKAKAQNSVGGITYDLAMAEFNRKEEQEDNAEDMYDPDA